MKIFTAAQMRAFDTTATETYGLPGAVLMENAALRVVEFLEHQFAPLRRQRVVILCGKGNNGGDGLAVARHLAAYPELRLTVVHAGKDAYRGDALIQARAWEAQGQRALVWAPEGGTVPTLAAIKSRVEDADIVIDAIHGAGFSGEVRPAQRDLLGLVFGPVGRGARIFVDLPSSLDADGGQLGFPLPTPLLDVARYTVTFGGPKRGLFARDGIEICGEIWVGEIGTLPRQVEETETGCEALTLDSLDAPRRSIDSNKGAAGRVLILGGSFGMSGAPTLAAKAALAIGAGLCTAALPAPVLPIFAAGCLESTSHPLPADAQGRLLAEAADHLPELWKSVQAVALGPGLSRSPQALQFAQRAVRECPKPLVIDADALYALKEISGEVAEREAPTLLTPHPGEMGELMGLTAKEVNENRYAVAADCAHKYGAFVNLKGSRSIVATPDGRLFVNLTGNPGMATGGAGDVLTGTVAGLLAQLKEPEAALKLAVAVHGLAGNLAHEELGIGLVAGDIAAKLPIALRKLREYRPERINGRLRRLI